MLKSIRIETLKTLGISAGLIVAIAASGAFLMARAAPGAAAAPAGATFSSLQAKSAANSFAASCTEGLTVDMRPDPKWVGESYADDNCFAPALPPFISGYAADGKKVDATMASLTAYTAKARVYQKCIANFVVAKKAEADRTHKPLNSGFEIIETHRIAASEANIKKVATEVQMTVDAYNENGSGCTDGGDITFEDNGGASNADSPDSSTG